MPLGAHLLMHAWDMLMWQNTMKQLVYAAGPCNQPKEQACASLLPT